MKKFFLFAAAVVAAMTVNAQTLYSFEGVTDDQITVNEYGALGTYTFNAGKENENVVPGVNYTSTEGDIMQVLISSMPNVVLQYKNGGLQEDGITMKDGHKDGIMAFHQNYLQTGGKNVEIVLSALQMDDEIILEVAAKGSTNAVFAVTGAEADDANVASVGKATKDGEGKDVYTVLKFYATGSEVSIKETAGGFRITKLTITPYNPNEDVENVKATVKAVKRFEKGQLVIIKNGIRYNALGAEL